MKTKTYEEFVPTAKKLILEAYQLNKELTPDAIHSKIVERLNNTAEVAWLTKYFYKQIDKHDTSEWEYVLTH